MIKNFLFDKLIEFLDFEPTPGQRQLLDELASFLSIPPADSVFLIKGYAGTGKTTIVNSIVKTLAELKSRTVLLAPTGRAAKVLAEYTHHIAYTIHKHIYRQKSSKDGLGNFVLNKNFFKNAFFIVDEASMIGDKRSENNIFGSGDLLNDLADYVRSGQNCHLILIGDSAQLPPVGLEISPALDRKYLERMGFNVIEFFLSDVVRTALDSGILKNATLIRQLIDSGKTSVSGLSTQGFTDIARITGTEVLEELDTSYSRYGIDETIVLSRTNKRANRFNTGIRNQILGREEEICNGDLLMVVKNNYFYNPDQQDIEFIANGDILRLEKISGHKTMYGHRFADARLTMVDYRDVEINARIILDTLSIDAPSLGIPEMRSLYDNIIEDYSEIGDRKQRILKMREDPYYNALQVKFAYAVTCHKAQGGQWKSVFIDLGYINTEMINTEFLRWLYTAFTRATEKLYLINFPDDFFSDN